MGLGGECCVLISNAMRQQLALHRNADAGYKLDVDHELIRDEGLAENWQPALRELDDDEYEQLLRTQDRQSRCVISILIILTFQADAQRNDQILAASLTINTKSCFRCK